MGGKSPPSSWKFAHSAPPWKTPLVDSPPATNFYPPPHQRLVSPSSILSNNFHVITQWKLVLIACSLYTQIMLILILNEAIFSFEKGANGQNDSSSGSHHPVKKFSRAKYLVRLPQWGDTHLPPLALFGRPWCINWSSLVHCYQHCVTVLHVPKCMNCHKTILVMNGMAYCFHGNT